MIHSLPPCSVPRTFASYDEASAFVSQCETETEARLNAAADEIARDCAVRAVRVLRLAGPTCSGKTTAAGKLRAALADRGMTVHTVSLDDFYLDRQVLDARTPSGGVPDYDSADTLDTDALHACAAALLSDGCAEVPVFDFESRCRTGTRRLDISGEQAPVLLFEGIQAVYPAVVRALSDAPARSIFVSVAQGLCVGGTLFPPDEVRLVRRLVRDACFRATEPDFTLHLWQSVRDNEENAILPHAALCDYTVNTLIPYELHALAPHLRRLLTETPVTGDYAPAAAALLGKLDGMTDIDSAQIPRDSLLREFLPSCRAD